MGKFFVYDTAQIPDWAMSAIMNRDYGELDDSKIDQIKKFLQSLPANFAHFEYGDECYFSYFPEFGLACNVFDVNVICQSAGLSF